MSIEVVHTNRSLEVSDNGSDEVFVKNLKSGVEIRISSRDEVITVTSHDGVMTPTAINGLDAFRIERRKDKR